MTDENAQPEQAGTPPPLVLKRPQVKVLTGKRNADGTAEVKLETPGAKQPE